MKRINAFPRPLAALSVLISFLLLTGLSSILRAAPLTPVPSAAIKAALQPFVDQKALGGAVALVATPDKVMAFDTVGYCQLSNQSPMRLDNYFWIASMTKTFTGVAIMMLVDEGKLTLDDPVEKFIPEFKGQMVMGGTDGQTPPHPPSHPITIREIMSHTSGIGDCRKLKNQSISLKEDADQYAHMPLLFEPGSKFMYNNAGIDTAGRIIEILSGMSYADFIKSRILDPLGMTDTTFWPSDEQAKRFAITTKRNKEKTEIEDRVLTDPLQPGVPPDMVRHMGWGQVKVYKNHYAMAAGGLYTSTADLLPFCRMLLGGGAYQGKRYLSEKAFQQFSTPQNGNAVKGLTEAYGVGCYVQIKSGPGLPSVGAIGHRGAAGTVFWMDPARKLVFILMMQGEQNDAIYNAFIKAGCQIAGVN